MFETRPRPSEHKEHETHVKVLISVHMVNVKRIFSYSSSNTYHVSSMVLTLSKNGRRNSCVFYGFYTKKITRHRIEDEIIGFIRCYCLDFKKSYRVP